ncbi:MAG: FtsQ-type POTRA domain-containing protein [Clostridia bacterium]|nr:FtsQ-type POTRA domain-containing protein [Clostridia bacterium]
MFWRKNQTDPEIEPKKEEKKRGFLADFFEPLPEGEEEAEGFADDLFLDEPEEAEPVSKKKKRRSLWDYANDDFIDEEIPEEPPKKKKKRGKAEEEAEDKPKKKKQKSAAAPVEGEAPKTAMEGPDGAALDGGDSAPEDGQELVIRREDPAEFLKEEPAKESPLSPKKGKEKAERIDLFAEDEAHQGEDIRLFDHDEYEGETQESQEQEKKRSSRSTLMDPGMGGAARVQLNQTEGFQRAEQAQRERQEREAKRQRQEYIEKQKRKRRRQRSLKQAAGNMALGAFIVAVVLLALYYGFLLSDIVITGTQTYGDAYIIQQSGLRYGQHMLTVDLEEAKASIEEDPYLQVDAISYIFPSRVRMVITERKATAGIVGLDYNVIIDNQGYVLAMGAGTDISNLIQVTGVSMTGFQLGQRLGEGDDFSTATLISMFQKLEEYGLMGNVKSIDLTTPLAITLTVSNGLKVFVGQPTDLDGKFASLQAELPAFLRQNIYWGTLFLSAKGGTVYSPRELAQILAQETTTPEGEEGEGSEGDAYGSIGANADPNAFEDPTLPGMDPMDGMGGGNYEVPDDFQG